MENRHFRISAAIIWGSSIVLGLLASVPQIAEAHFHAKEAFINAAVTAAFS
ncbi:MAG TPA: hypothetical protein VL053_00025 [Arachidicoccus sp.]|nr:hypothetical protein [Arachidicoccus sp.]